MSHVKSVRSKDSQLRVVNTRFLLSTQVGENVTETKPNLWVIDDDNGIRSLLCEFFQAQGFSVSTFSRLQEVRLVLANTPADKLAVDLILSDINMPGESGLQFLETMIDSIPCPMILMTAFGSIESAIDAMRKGAFDYVIKPFKLAELKVVVERALEVRQLKKENSFLRATLEQSQSKEGIIGKSPKMQAVFEVIKRVAQTTANILINGESGTGKEMVARAIHESGPRAHKPFIAINCAAIPANLLESELFGYVKGAFTGAVSSKVGLFEAADGGTLFLDEIGDMSFDLQAKLLRVLQERKIRAIGDTRTKDIDVRFISATHKDLSQAMKKGTFREDLFYRLSVIPVALPPLRERGDDIILLAQHFAKKYSALHRLNRTSFSRQAMEELLHRSWPGNVRELENAIERAVILSNNSTIQLEDLPRLETGDVSTFIAGMKEALPTLDELERDYIRFVLEKTNGHKEKAAHILGINRRTLYRKDLGAPIPSRLHAVHDSPAVEKGFN